MSDKETIEVCGIRFSADEVLSVTVMRPDGDIKFRRHHRPIGVVCSGIGSATSGTGINVSGHGVSVTQTIMESATFSPASRFTDRARKVMQLANQEAQRFNHEYIGTEHVVIALMKENDGIGAHVLKNHNIDMAKIRAAVERHIKPAEQIVQMGKLPQTPRLQRCVAYAASEATKLGSSVIATEHLLLGLLREPEGIGFQVLYEFGLSLEGTRNEVKGMTSAE